MVTRDFSAFAFAAPSTQLCMRKGGQNFSCNMTATEPTKPYLALRAGGKNVYAPLVAPTNDSFPLRIKIGNNTLAPQSSAGGGTSTGNVGTLTETAENMLSTHETMYLGTIYREVQAQNGATLTLVKEESGDFDNDVHPGFDFEVGDEVVLHHSKKKGSVTNSYAGTYEIRKILSVTDGEDEDDWGCPQKIITLDAAPDLDLTNYYVQAAVVLVVKNFLLLNNQAERFFYLENGTFTQIDTYNDSIDWDTLEQTHGNGVTVYVFDFEPEILTDEELEARHDNGDYEDMSVVVKSGLYVNVNGARKNIYFISDYDESDDDGDRTYHVQPYYGDGSGSVGENGGLLPLKVTGKLIYVNSTITTDEYTIPLGDGLLIWANEVLTF